jgi:hypothetical protein
MSNELSVSGSNVPAHLAEYGSLGAEHLEQEHISTPHLYLLQKMSDAVEDDLGKPGQLLFTNTDTVLDGPVEVAILAVNKLWELLKNPSNVKEGVEFSGTKEEVEGYSEGSTEWEDNTPPAANEVFRFLCVEVNEHGIDPTKQGAFVVVMSKTNLKLARKINNALRQFGQSGAPIFGMTFLLGSEKHANEQHSWFQWTAKANGPIESPEFVGMLL